jgi:proline dehydrogenase
MLPDANPLIRLSSKILETRPSILIPIAFPGCAHSTDLDVLHNTTKGPDSRTEDDISSLFQLHADMVHICTRAQEKGVRVVIDAEYRSVHLSFCSVTSDLMSFLVGTNPP